MKLVRDNIKKLQEYKPNEDTCKIKLDANEGRNFLFKSIKEDGIKFPEGFDINVYPDNDAALLRDEIGKYINVDPKNIVAGNGSSEMIELIMKTYIDEGDSIVSFVPTFSMYMIFSQIYSANFIGVESNEDFSVDMDKLIQKVDEINPKVIFLCNPNNPTGHLVKKDKIKKLLDNIDCILVVDEAYIEFAEGSMVDEILNYENLIVLRTLSKALGLAGIRLGYMVTNEDIIRTINKVKSPYNLNSISQYIGINALKNKDRIAEYVKDVKIEREFLYNSLTQLSFQVYEPNGNFIFFKSDIKDLDAKLEEKGILIRAFSDRLNNFYRVTVGEGWQNKEFIKSLKEILKDENS